MTILSRDIGVYVTATSRAMVAVGLAYWALLISSYVSPNRFSNALEGAFFVALLGLLFVLLLLGWAKPAFICVLVILSTALVGPLKWESKVLWLDIHMSQLSRLIGDIKKGRNVSGGIPAKSENSEMNGIPNGVLAVETIRCGHNTLIVRLIMTRINGIPAGYLFDDCDDRKLSIVNGANKSPTVHYYPAVKGWYSFTE